MGGAAVRPRELPKCPTPAVTSYPKLTGFKHVYYLTVLEIRNPKSVFGANSACGQGWLLPEALEKNRVLASPSLSVFLGSWPLPPPSGAWSILTSLSDSPSCLSEKPV